MKVSLFDYGAGNLHSLGKALRAAGANVVVTTDPEEALGTDALVLPGVGAFGAAVGALGDAATRIRDALRAGHACLGICLGMQLLFEESEESSGRGIGLLPGRVRRLRGRRVPHMGWNDVETADDPLFHGVPSPVVYYANGYVCEPTDPSAAIAWTRHEERRFVAAVRRARTWGVQFHPEKSSRDGLRVVRNFLDRVRTPAAGGSA